MKLSCLFTLEYMIECPIHIRTCAYALNTSNCLPISCSLDLAHVRDPPALATLIDTLDWVEAVRTGEVSEPQITLLNKDCSDIEDL